MSFITQNQMGGSAGSGKSSASGDFEATLRLIARLSAPEGLEERVKAGLLAAPASSKARILMWPTAQRMDTAWMRSAAAAAIFAVVVGGSWGVYSRVQPNQPARAVATPPRVSNQGGFSSAGAMRTPQTLNGPMVAHPSVARPAVTAPEAAKPDVRSAIRRGKPATKSVVNQPATLPAR